MEKLNLVPWSLSRLTLNNRAYYFLFGFGVEVACTKPSVAFHRKACLNFGAHCLVFILNDGPKCGSDFPKNVMPCSSSDRYIKTAVLV